MKTIKHCVSLLCIGIILFSSCTKSTVPPHLKAIPADAVFVVAFENAQLIKKGGLDKLKDYKFFQSIKEELAGQEPRVQDFFNKLLENPASSGLDLKQSYIYGVKVENGFYGAATFKINKASTLEDNLTELLKEEDIEIEDNGDYKLISPTRDVAFVWNKEVFLIYTGDLEGVNYGEAFSLSDEESVAGVADFQEFQKQKYDVGFWASCGQFLDIIEKEAAIQYPAFMSGFSDTYVHAYLHFNNGEIKVTGKMSPQSKMDEFYAKYPLIKKDFNNSLLEDFPENSYLSIKMAVNWEEYMKFFSEVASSANNYDYDFQSILNDPTAKTILNALDGDILLSLYGFAQGPVPIPLLGISFSVKNEEAFKSLLTLIPQEILQQAGDFYTVGAMGMSAYIAYKDKRVFVTDDAEAITAFTGKGYDKNLKNSPLADSYKNDPSLFYLNLDLKSYPVSIQSLLQNETPRYAKSYLSLLDTYKDFSYGTTKDNEFYLSLKFKDNSQNALKLFIKSLDDAAAQSNN
jgi:hypothetical protein